MWKYHGETLLRFGGQGMLPRGNGFKRDTPHTPTKDKEDRRVKSEEREGFPGRGHNPDKGSEDFRERTANSGNSNTRSKKAACGAAPQMPPNECGCDPQSSWEPWRALELRERGG